MPNGTTSTVNVAKVGGVAPTTTTFTDALLADKLYSYVVNSDGEYELTEVSGENLAGHEAYNADTTAPAYDNKKLAGYDIVDEAEIMVIYTDTDGVTKKATTLTGAQLKTAYGTDTEYGAKAYVLLDEVSGFNAVTVGLIIADSKPDTGIGTNYGYLTAATSRSDNGSTYTRVFTVWDGSSDESMTLTEVTTNQDLTLFKAGTFIKFSVVDAEAGTIKDVEEIKVTQAAVKAYGGLNTDKQGEFYTDTAVVDSEGPFTITSETIVFAVDHENTSAVPGDVSINTATKDGETYLNNVMYYKSGTGSTLSLLVVDSTNSTGAVNVKPADPVETVAKAELSATATATENANAIYNALAHATLNEVVITGTAAQIMAALALGESADIPNYTTEIAANKTVTINVTEGNLTAYAELKGKLTVNLQGADATADASMVTLSDGAALTVNGGKVVALPATIPANATVSAAAVELDGNVTVGGTLTATSIAAGANTVTVNGTGVVTTDSFSATAEPEIGGGATLTVNGDYTAPLPTVGAARLTVTGAVVFTTPTVADLKLVDGTKFDTIKLTAPSDAAAIGDYFFGLLGDGKGATPEVGANPVPVGTYKWTTYYVTDGLGGFMMSTDKAWVLQP